MQNTSSLLPLLLLPQFDLLLLLFSFPLSLPKDQKGKDWEAFNLVNDIRFFCLTKKERTKNNIKKLSLVTLKIEKNNSLPSFLHRYSASFLRFAAISGSHLSPLSSSFCLSYSSSSLVSVQNSKLGPSTIASTGQASWQNPQ